MISKPLDLEEATEVLRIDLSDALRVGVRVVAEDAAAGVVELRRAYGDDGPAVPFSPAKTIAINGSQLLDIPVDDCSHLAVFVTTAGSGSFEVEWEPQGRTLGTLQAKILDLSQEGTVFEQLGLSDYDRRVSIVVSPNESTTAALELRTRVDLQGGSVAQGSIALDESVTTFDLGPVSGYEIKCTTEDADAVAFAWVYSCANMESVGILSDNVAFTDAAQEFTAANLFSGGLSIGDLATGLSTIDTDATANRAVTFPDAEGEICIMTDLSPAYGEMLYRDGDGFELTDVIKYGTISIFETLTIEADFVEISGAAAWGISAPDAVFQNTLSSLGALITLLESSSKGTNGLGFKAPATVGPSGAVDYTLPTKPSSGNQILLTDASGVMSWMPISGSTPPSSPFDGQPFWKDGELFHWDDTRGKWLGELREIHVSRQYAAAAPTTLQLRAGGDAILDTLTGWLWDDDVTIVEARGWSKLAMTGDLDLMQASTKLNTVLSWSSSKYASSKTLNISVNGVTSVERKFKIQNVSLGTVDDPYIIVGYRKELT